MEVAKWTKRIRFIIRIRMTSDKYFTFPLSILNGAEKNPTPTSCLELALRYGAYNAGLGYLKNHCREDFEEKLEMACDYYNLSHKLIEQESFKRHCYLVGAKICGITLDWNFNEFLARTRTITDFIERQESLKTPFIRISASFLWAAIKQARYEDSGFEKPERGISWREFRVLIAILSWPTTKEGFTSIGWESIQFRSAGFLNKKEFKAATQIPDHLPMLSRKQIRGTLDTLEALNFFARFRLSSGTRGGRFFYSFRHDRDVLAKAVCDKVNFQDRLRVAQHREEDARKCLELLERAKSGTSL